MSDLGIALAAARLAAGDEEAVHTVLGRILEAADAVQQAADEPAAEALASGLLQAFARGGEAAKALLSELCLDLLPRLAALAAASPAAAVALGELAGLAAGAAAPREALTAFMETLSAQARGCDAPGTLLLLNALVDLTPALLGRLQRRRGATLVDALPAVAAVAQVQGEVLDSYAAAQHAAQTTGPSSSGSGPPAVAERVDAAYANAWRRYVTFVQQSYRQVLAVDSDNSAIQPALAAFVLRLLACLTATWQPPTAATAAAPHAGPAAASSSAASQTSSSDDIASNGAAGVARRLVGLLPGLGVGSWQQLQACAAGGGCTRPGPGGPGSEKDSDDDTDPLLLQQPSVGAGLAAFYGLLWPAPLALPQGAAAIVQAACQLALPLGGAAAEEQSMALLHKAIGLLTLAGHQAQAEPPAAGPAGVQQLAAALQPVVDMLCSHMAFSGSQQISRASQAALDSLLGGLPPAARLAAYQRLLVPDAAAGGQLQPLHPEACAIVLQSLRKEVAAAGAPSGAGSEGAVDTRAALELALAWLRRGGPGGYGDEEGLAQHANAVCAALNLLYLVMRRQQAGGGAGVVVPVAQLLEGVLQPLEATVASALQQLGGGAPAGATAGSPACGQPPAQAEGPGEAMGDGQAVDAWLAVTRVQEVLGWVLEEAQEQQQEQEQGSSGKTGGS